MRIDSINKHGGERDAIRIQTRSRISRLRIQITICSPGVPREAPQLSPEQSLEIPLSDRFPCPAPDRPLGRRDQIQASNGSKPPPVNDRYTAA